MGAYPLVNIHNSAQDVACGTVQYASAFCSNDDYCVSPGRTWTASSRGVCLITKITASVQTPGGDTVAVEYTSSGTSYSTFAVISSDNGYAVTRIVN